MQGPNRKKTFIVVEGAERYVTEIEDRVLNIENVIQKKKGKIIIHNKPIVKRSTEEIENNEYLEIIFKVKNNSNDNTGPKNENHNQLPKSTKGDPIEEKIPINPIFLKYKEKLKYRYQTNYAYMRSFFWEGKRNDLPIENHFVQLIVEKTDLYGKKNGEAITLEEIFSKEENGHQTILVTGGPGYGKTTLCKKIAYDWATDEISCTYLKHFDLVAVISLRELGDKSLNDLVLHNIFQNAEEELMSKIEEENMNILVMLDGFDEISNKSSVLDFIREESFDISLRMTILVTSREQVTEEIRQDMKSRFSLKGFSTQQQQNYIKLVFDEDKDKGIELYGMLEKSDVYSEIGKCPLMLHMLCCLHLYDDKDMIESMTALYVRIFSLITKRYISKNSGDPKLKKGKYFLGEDLLIRLGKLFFNKNEITSKDLKDHFPVEEEFNFIVGLDILEFYYFFGYDSDVRYEFTHSSFKEFLSALTAYNDISHYNYDSNDNALIFLLGLLGSESIPRKLNDYFGEQVRTPKFMIQAYREMKFKRNWELFCSLSNVKFYDIDLEDMKVLLPLYQFTEVHFCFPENTEEYEERRDELIDFYNNYKFSDKLVILLFPIVSMDKWENGHDLREVTSCIIDFYNKIGPIRNRIYFSGIYHYINRFYYFLNYKTSAVEISEEVMEELALGKNEQVVSLQTINSSCCFVNYLISAEQHRLLNDQIRISTCPEKKGICTIV